MKSKQLMLAVTMMLCIPAVLGFAQWQPMGPPGGNFRALAMAPSNNNIQYLATSGSPCNIWKTTDGGNNWSRVGAVSYYVYSMSVDPVNPNNVYAGGVYMYKSTNGGTTWTQLTLPSSHYYFYDLKVHPVTPTTIMSSCYIYAGNYYRIGFVKSTNSGTSWSSETLSVDTSYAYALAIDPTNTNNIYVGGYARMSGTYTPCVYKSTDGGSNFMATGALPGSGYYCYSLLVHQTIPSYVYAGTMYGLYRSTDGGVSWTLVSTTSYYYNYSLCTTPANPSIIYAGGSGLIHRSTDAGATWSQFSSGLAGSIFYGVTVSKTVAANVYAVNNCDFFRSTDTGASWAVAHNGLLAAPISAMANAPSAQGTVYADNEGVALYKTTNCGASWTPLTKPLSCGSLCDLAVYNNNPNTVLAFEGSG